MSGKRVPVLAPDGQFGFVDESDLPSLPEGARALTKAQADIVVKERQQQAAQAAEDARYEAMPLPQKALGIASSLASTINPLTIGSDPNAPPTAAAYGQGVREGLTGGLSSGATRQAVQALAGKPAAERYAAQVDQTAQASPIAHGAGELAGLAGGLVAPVGAAAEAGAGALAAKVGLEGASVLGKAGLSAAKLGARGAVEGAIIKGGEYVGETMLHDDELSKDKLFSAIGTGGLYGGATGAVLGAGGSLIKSGIGAGLRSAANALARGGEDAATAAAGVERAAVEGAADVEATAQKAASSWLTDLGSEAGTKNRALDRMWAAIGKGFGLQSTEFAERAARYLPNGTRDVAETLVRKGVFNPRANPIEAAQALTPKAVLPKIETALEATGKQLGTITDASGGRVEGRAIVDAVEDVARQYDYAATKPIARAIRSFGTDLEESLGLANFGVGPDGRTPIRNINSFGEKIYSSASVQDLLRERKALDHMVFDNAALNASATIDAKRELRSKLERLVVDALDNSSGRLSGELATEYKALKKDYLSLNIARDVAADSAARAEKAAFLSLGALTAGGGNVLKSVAYKVAKERGDAFAAAALWQEAERGRLAGWINKQNNLIDRAAKGLIALPEKGAASAAEKMPAPRGLATRTLARIAAFQADPETFVDHATREVEPIEAHSPELASGIVARQVRAMTFLSSKMPQGAEPDPLDPHPVERMTPNEETKLARYAWYCDRPERFFAEVARGKLTPEGAETAQYLMPDAFADLQARTSEELAKQLARGNKAPYRQRLLLGELLDFAATPGQRPEHRSFLQQNVSPVLPSDQAPAAGVAPAHKQRATSTPQRSILDRLEGSGLGHR